MINIFEIIATALISIAAGTILVIGVLHGTDTPEWAETSLVTITTLQIFIHFSSTQSPQETTDAE